MILIGLAVFFVLVMAWAVIDSWRAMGELAEYLDEKLEERIQKILKKAEGLQLQQIQTPPSSSSSSTTNSITFAG